MYTSQYYTNPEIDERLLQGYYDDAVAAGFTGSKADFHQALIKARALSEGVSDIDSLHSITDLGTYLYIGHGWKGLVNVNFDASNKVSQVALSSSTPSYENDSLTWLSGKPCVMVRTYTNNAWSAWSKAGADVVNDLVTGGTDKALSAEQGKVLDQKVDALGPKIDNIEAEVTDSTSEVIEVQNDAGTETIFSISNNGVDAKNLKSNGQPVLTQHQDISGKMDKIGDIEQEEQKFTGQSVEFDDDNGNFVAEVTPDGFAAKKFLIKTSPTDEGTDLTDLIGSAPVRSLLGLTDIVHVIGYGQSLMAGTNSGTALTTSQRKGNLFRFVGGVRPYDALNLDARRRVHITRIAAQPTYLELSDKKAQCLSPSDITLLDGAFASLTPLTEQRQRYAQSGDGYTPNSNGDYNLNHANGETPLSGTCEQLVTSLATRYGSNLGFDIIATCCAYGSADVPSLSPLDRDGRIHNYEDSISSDGSNLNYFDLLIASVKAAKTLADAAEKSYSVGIVVYMEANTITGTGVSLTNSLRAYRTSQLFTLINQRVKAITHQTNDIVFFLDQSKTYSNQREAMRILGTMAVIELTQSEQNTLKTLANYDVEPYTPSNIYLVTPPNAYEMGPDHIHHTATAQKVKGATIGEAAANVLGGRGFNPLYPINVKVIGNDIYVKYHVPVSPIVIDVAAVNGTQTCPTCVERGDKYGFAIYDGTSYLDIITSVEVSEPDTIKISCSQNPTGLALEYCFRPVSNAGTGLPTNCEFGNIRDSQGNICSIDIDGTDYALHNWSIGFSYDL